MMNTACENGISALPQWHSERWTPGTKFWGTLLLGLTLIGGAYLFGNRLAMVMVLFGTIGAGIVFALPIHYSVFAYLGYLMVDGGIKILSNYHPITHIGQDLFVIILILRSISDRSRNGLMQYANTPGLSYLAIFLIWLALQYVNPFGLGILPSIAGTKLYLTMFLLFLLIYHHMPRRLIPGLFRWIVILACIQGIISLVEYYFFKEQIFNLHPKYRQIAGDKFIGLFYRPFGTTSSPGAPSVWMALAAPHASYLFIKNQSPWRDRILALAFLAIAVPTLVVCQVRVAMVVGGLSVLLIAGFALWRSGSRHSRWLIPILILFGSIAAIVYPHLQAKHSDDPFSAIAERRMEQDPLYQATNEQLSSRALSIFQTKTFTRARSGALEGMLDLAEHTIFGIGLSRIGAASAVWRSRIDQDPFFGPRWSFADNLYRAIFTEIGLPGLITWLTFVGFYLIRLIKGVFQSENGDKLLIWTCLIAVGLQLVSAFGNEGILYAPVSTFFWMMLAFGQKECAQQGVRG